ncbi:hypothetical protein UA45_08220 [Morganella morganii]|uniref:Uncharacterized protein n=1 Tax=Morganella morganii TaxID=582 RepID=A0A0D8L8F0_MORMO|nr:hypothetical protein UA45_08220 [Morganella morganii]
MNKYRDKSDFEINKAVAVLTGAVPFSFGATEFRRSSVSGMESAIIIKSPRKVGAFAPCNTPADAMPIIIENGISSIFNGDEWICSALDGEFLSINENLYRAGCEVFLMMKDAENES